MKHRPQNMSDRPVKVETKVTGFEPDDCEILGQSLEFSFFQGRRTYYPYPHTTGWRVLPFSMFVCILSGRVVFRRDGQPDLVVRRGEALLLPAGVRHKADVPGRAGVRSIWLHFNYRLLTALDLFALLEPPLRIVGKAATEGRDICRQIIDLHGHTVDEPLRTVARRREATSRFLAYLVRICRSRSGHPELIRISQRLKPALAYLEEHQTEPLRRDELARRAGLSRTRFHELFRRLTGMTPIDYLKHRRLRAAQVLLISTDRSVADVGNAVGYRDPFHFSRQFKAAFGVSPRAFRRQHHVSR